MRDALYVGVVVLCVTRSIFYVVGSHMYGSPGGTFLLIIYLITYHFIYHPYNGGTLHRTFPVIGVALVEVEGSVYSPDRA